MKRYTLIFLLILSIIPSSLFAMMKRNEKKLETVKVKDNSTLEIAYVGNEKESIEITPSLQSGETRSVKYTSSDGDLTFDIQGENENLPELLINEFITKGKPDKIELYALTSGNLEGCTLVYGKNDKVTSYTLSSKDVNEGDFIVIPLEEGLSANNGFIELRATASPFSRLIDKVFYTNKGDEDNSEGWSGEGVDSSYSTTTRSINRKSENGVPQDTDTLDDWYVTKTRGASWGKRNTEEIYVKV